MTDHGQQAIVLPVKMVLTMMTDMTTKRSLYQTPGKSFLAEGE